MMKLLQFKKIIAILSILSFIVIGVYLVTYKYPHTNWVSMEPVTNISAKNLLKEFESGGGDEKINQIIQISGIISSLKDSLYIIDNSVVCIPENKIENQIKLNKYVIVKGRCIGFDDLLGEIRMDHTILMD